jgi:hypothetical protein
VRGGKSSGVLGAHLELGLIGAAAEFGGRSAANQAPAEEPFIPLSDVIAVRIGNRALRNRLLCPLRFEI